MRIKIAITDACIFIDIYDLDLIAAFFNLQFEIHEKTDRLMVKFVDRTDQRVIKEFPPRELLDTLAAIQEYVGVLLDKKV